MTVGFQSAGHCRRAGTRFAPHHSRAQSRRSHCPEGGSAPRKGRRAADPSQPGRIWPQRVRNRVGIQAEVAQQVQREGRCSPHGPRVDDAVDRQADGLAVTQEGVLIEDQPCLFGEAAKQGQHTAFPTEAARRGAILIEQLHGLTPERRHEIGRSQAWLLLPPRGVNVTLNRPLMMIGRLRSFGIHQLEPVPWRDVVHDLALVEGSPEIFVLPFGSLPELISLP